jgi:hypothetical protein
MPDQIGTRDMVVMPDLGPAHAEEEFFSAVRVGYSTPPLARVRRNHI